jgi:hypothetical protein
MKFLLLIGLAIIASVIFVSPTVLAEQLSFADWVGIEETDAATNTKNRQIGTFAGNRSNSLWLAASASDRDRIQLTLKSDKMMTSNYYYYRIDRVDTLTIRSAIKGCDAKCLIDEVEKNGELIRTMRRGLRINFEYDSSPDIVQKSTFSLRGFTRAYNWLLSK